MEHRKNLNKDLRRQSGLFFQIGLLIAMMLCVSAFEYTAKKEYKPVDITMGEPEDDWSPPITVDPPPRPPKPKVVPKIVPIDDEEPIEDLKVEVVFDPDELQDIEIPEVEPPTERISDEPFIRVEEMPSPSNGFESFYTYINKNLKYPRQARNMQIEGKVYVKFVVLENGELGQIHIMKGIGAGCDEEVLRVMKNAPKWNPGKQRGKPVKVWQVVPIYFKLD